MKKSLKLSVLLLSATILFSSCIGSFRLTNKVKDWNSNVSNKFVNEIIFLAFHIIPVYEVTMFVDALVFNSIEFWTGKKANVKVAEKTQENDIEVTASL